MLLSDKTITLLCQGDKPLITPFHGKSISKLKAGTNDAIRKVCSLGLSSFGYDLSLGNSFKVLRRASEVSGARIIDPNDFDQSLYREVNLNDGQTFVLPPHGCALAVSKERLAMPEDVTGIAMQKSTIARSMMEVTVTPLEAGWEGFLTLEFHNKTDFPIHLLVGQGIVQVLFIKGDQMCETSYAKRGGKYQNQGAEAVAPRIKEDEPAVSAPQAAVTAADAGKLTELIVGASLGELTLSSRYSNYSVTDMEDFLNLSRLTNLANSQEANPDNYIRMKFVTYGQRDRSIFALFDIVNNGVTLGKKAVVIGRDNRAECGVDARVLPHAVNNGDFVTVTLEGNVTFGGQYIFFGVPYSNNKYDFITPYEPAMIATSDAEWQKRAAAEKENRPFPVKGALLRRAVTTSEEDDSRRTVEYLADGQGSWKIYEFSPSPEVPSYMPEDGMAAYDETQIHDAFLQTRSPEYAGKYFHSDRVMPLFNYSTFQVEAAIRDLFYSMSKDHLATALKYHDIEFNETHFMNAMDHVGLGFHVHNGYSNTTLAKFLRSVTLASKAATCDQANFTAEMDASKLLHVVETLIRYKRVTDNDQGLRLAKINTSFYIQLYTIPLRKPAAVPVNGQVISKACNDKNQQVDTISNGVGGTRDKAYYSENCGYVFKPAEFIDEMFASIVLVPNLNIFIDAVRYSYSQYDPAKVEGWARSAFDTLWDSLEMLQAFPPGTHHMPDKEKTIDGWCKVAKGYLTDSAIFRELQSFLIAAYNAKIIDPKDKFTQLLPRADDRFKQMLEALHRLGKVREPFSQMAPGIMQFYGMVVQDRNTVMKSVMDTLKMLGKNSPLLSNELAAAGISNEYGGPLISASMTTRIRVETPNARWSTTLHEFIVSVLDELSNQDKLPAEDGATYKFVMALSNAAFPDSTKEVAQQAQPSRTARTRYQQPPMLVITHAEGQTVGNLQRIGNLNQVTGFLSNGFKTDGGLTIWAHTLRRHDVTEADWATLFVYYAMLELYNYRAESALTVDMTGLVAVLETVVKIDWNPKDGLSMAESDEASITEAARVVVANAHAKGGQTNNFNKS